jgi:probable rRNA maturation factor
MNLGMNDQKHVPGRHADRAGWCFRMGDPLPCISVRNLQRKIGVNVGELETFAAGAVQRSLQLRKGKRSDLRKLLEVFVWLISDRRMAVLHRQFLGQSGPTDVLTFQHGEIFISVETARRHARAFGNSLTRELELYIIHGLLHLHGFDDQTPGEARKMGAAQEKILRGALE